MDFNSILYLFVGSTFGLIIRIFINYNFKIKIGIYINTTTVINFLASFLLGFFVALDLSNKQLLLLFNIGFLGCFSTFSSFIYDLFILLRGRHFVHLILHYVEVIVLSLFFFSWVIF